MKKGPVRSSFPYTALCLPLKPWGARLSFLRKLTVFPLSVPMAQTAILPPKLQRTISHRPQLPTPRTLAALGVPRASCERTSTRSRGEFGFTGKRAGAGFLREQSCPHRELGLPWQCQAPPANWHQETRGVSFSVQKFSQTKAESI